MTVGELILQLEDMVGLPFSYIVIVGVFVVFVAYCILTVVKGDDREDGVAQVVLSQMQKDNKANREETAKALREVVNTIPQIIQASMPRQQFPQFPPQYPPQQQFAQPTPQGQIPFGFPPQSQLPYGLTPQQTYAPAPAPQPQPPAPQSQIYQSDIPSVLQDGSYAIGFVTNPDSSRTVRYIKPANTPQGYEYVDHTFPAPASKPQENKPEEPQEAPDPKGTGSKLGKLLTKVENASKKSKVGEQQETQ